MSTTVVALRLGRPRLAFSNVLGPNIFNHLLLLLTDVADGSRALFASIDDSAAVAAAVGVVLVGIYIARLAGPASGVYVTGTALVFPVGR